MLAALISLIFLYLTILGFSKIFYLRSNENLSIYSSLYGLFLLITLCLIFNFFFPLKFFSILIIILGICLFFKFFKDFKEISFIISLFFIIFLLFNMASNGPNYDTMLYHHQVVNWPYFNKIFLNIVEADIRLGMTSPWQLLLSLFNFRYFNYPSSLLINFIPFLLFFIFALKSIKTQKKVFSDFFIIFSIFFILVFSIIHPFGNGIIMMHLGSLETDAVGMIFFIFSYFFFFKSLENKDNDRYVDYLIISVAISLFCRIGNAPLIILPMFILIKKKSTINHRLIISLTLITVLLWLVRSFLISGCLIFPISFTCLDTQYFLSIDEIKSYLLTVKSFARSAPDRIYFQNYEATISSLLWFKTWFFGYFLKTSLIQISIFSSLLSILVILFQKNIKRKININHLITILSFILIFMIWMQAPDVRFALGLFVILPCYFLSMILINIKTIKLSPMIILFFSFLIFSFTLKNHKNIKYLSLNIFYERNYNLLELKKISILENIQIFRSSKNNGFCYDMYGICIDSNQINFEIVNLQGWYYFKKLDN